MDQSQVSLFSVYNRPVVFMVMAACTHLKTLSARLESFPAHLSRLSVLRWQVRAIRLSLLTLRLGTCQVSEQFSPRSPHARAV